MPGPYRIDNAPVRDAGTGELNTALVGEQIQIVVRDTTTPYAIQDGAADPIPSSLLTVQPSYSVPTFWIETDEPADLYLDWYHPGSGARGPVNFDAALRAAAAAAAAAAEVAASSAALAEEAAVAAAADAEQNAGVLSIGGMTGQITGDQLADTLAPTFASLIDSTVDAALVGTPREVFIDDDLAFPRPDWPGPVYWVTTLVNGTPLHAIDGDHVIVVGAEPLPWTPWLLPGLHLWLDAQSLTMADGAAVASWPDVSGNARHFTQATEASQPVLDADRINGYPAVVGNGTNSRLATADFATLTGQEFTIYLVAGTDLADVVTSSDVLLDASSTVTVSMRNTLYRTVNQAASLARHPSSNILTSAADTWGTGPKIIRAATWGSSSSTRIDDTVIASGTTSLSGVAVSRWSLFGLDTGLNCFPGYVGEVIFVAGRVSEDDDALVMAYLSDRWGL